MKDKKWALIRFICLCITGLLCIYLLVYCVSLILYNSDKQKQIIQEEMKQDILFQPNLDHIVSVLWKDSSTLYLLRQRFDSSADTANHNQLTLLEYDVFKREISNEGDISNLENAILGRFDNKSVLCTWRFIKRESKDQVATKVAILDINSKESLKQIDLYSMVKLDICHDNTIKVSEGLPILAPTNESYNIHTQEKLIENIPAYEIKGSSNTEIYFDDKKLFTLDLPNKYTSVSVLPNTSSYVLIDVDGKILIYIKQ
jgi:hypothetical protein